VADRELHITTSIGISLYPGDGYDAQTLLMNAEVALYRAKDSGRNTYKLYSPAMNAKALERLMIEGSMRKAIEQDEFELFYQPQISIYSGEIVGVEALIRWNSKVHGFVSPGVFIPIAEESDLVFLIGEWVIKEACRQCKEWEDAGHPPVRVSINLSARQFQQHNLVDIIDEALLGTGVSPELLEFEITESALMKDADKAIEILNEIKNRGIHIAMDDFGTGYSSFGYLKRFPIDRLKIDKMFVDSIITDKSDSAIVSAIIATAKSLGMQSLAEGVETEGQLVCLQELGCNEMQGYLFSKPLPVSEISKVLRQPPRHLDVFWQQLDSKIA
ncbi:MAG: EAL domain-containing protein, partial [Rubrobacteridae bacterium]|nr:EAL domain-containing protein [Rubrobacteridae bacterium]